jgi:hypothetical protein
MTKSPSTPEIAPATDPLELLARGPKAMLAPAAARRVRKPDGVLLAEGGEQVDFASHTSFWIRLLSDGDVVILPDINTTQGDAA